MPRPKRQDARRASIIEAAGKAIGERGLAGVRVRDIAAQAGLSPGSVLYYYPELTELMLEVHSETVNSYFATRTNTTAEIADPVHRLIAAVESGLPAGPEDAVCRVLYEMHSLADRSTPHATVMSSLYDREVALYTGIVEVGAAAGRFTPSRPVPEVARDVVVLEDGYGLHIMSRNRSVGVAAARENILRYLAAVLGCGELLSEL